MCKWVALNALLGSRYRKKSVNVSPGLWSLPYIDPEICVFRRRNIKDIPNVSSHGIQHSASARSNSVKNREHWICSLKEAEVQRKTNRICKIIQSFSRYDFRPVGWFFSPSTISFGGEQQQETLASWDREGIAYTRSIDKVKVPLVAPLIINWISKVASVPRSPPILFRAVHLVTVKGF